MNLPRYLLLVLIALVLGGFAAKAVAGANDCQLSLSQNVLDYGLMNRAIRADSASERNLGERHLSLTLSCAQPTDMSVFYRAMAANTERFHFAERGSYQVRIHDALLDGRPVDLGLIAGVGQPPVHTASTLSWRPAHGIVPVQAGVPVQGRRFSAQVELTAWVREHGLQVRDAVSWEASGVFDAVGIGRSKEAILRARFAPAACDPSLSNGGIVDFGTLSVSELNADKDTALPPKSLTLRVSCEAPTAFALIMQDNRVGSATVVSDTHYGLGLDPRNNRIGLYSVSVNTANASADSFGRLYRTDSSDRSVWSTADSTTAPISQKSAVGFTDSAHSTAGPVAIENLATSVTVDALIAPTNSLDLSSAIDLDGSATIEIIYL